LDSQLSTAHVGFQPLGELVFHVGLERHGLRHGLQLQ
jgi:hypothetical protein